MVFSMRSVALRFGDSVLAVVMDGLLMVIMGNLLVA